MHQLKATINNLNKDAKYVHIKSNNKVQTNKHISRGIQTISISALLISLARAGRHCRVASGGGAGFLVLHKLDKVQVMFLKKADYIILGKKVTLL